MSEPETVKKITIYHNPTPLFPRWDCDIVHDDGERERIVNINEEKAIDLIKTAFKNPKGE